MKKMVKYITLAMVGICFLACQAQVPAGKPVCVDEDFDREVARWLSFTVPLKGVGELSEEKLGDYLILDVREKAEYEVAHIPGAVYVGYGDFDISSLDEVDKEQAIIVYCSIGYRSEKIGEKLLGAGFTQVQNLYGSIFEWVNQGQAIVDAQGETTRKIHTYNKQWSKWVSNKTYQKTW